MISSLWSSAIVPEVKNEEKISVPTNQSVDHPTACSSSDGPISSLEGKLHVRKGRSSGHLTTSWSWKHRFVYLHFNDGGSISVYKECPEAHSRVLLLDSIIEQPPTSALRTAYSRIHGSRSSRDQSRADGNLELDITSDLPWVAKDVENDPVTFIVEISTLSSVSGGGGDSTLYGGSMGHSALTVDTSATFLSAAADVDDYQDDLTAFASDDDNDDEDESVMDEDGGEEEQFETTEQQGIVPSRQDDFLDELNCALSKGKPLRLYFRCGVGTNEKALWLNAFQKIGRLSKDIHRKKTLFFNSFSMGSSRIRKKANERIALDARQLDLSETPVDSDTADLTNDVEVLARGGKGTVKDKEFRILPAYSYPHRWFTKSEMREEMVLPSEHFHDLRIPGCKDKEIGSLKVEVLQCLGLPKLDRGSDTDALVYLVCGSYAFATDVIGNRTNPMWLRKTRRACIFPLFHGYSRLYVGVFDYEGRKIKDDFAGRVSVDLARLRPRSSYDVTLPLRLSTHVYSRRGRGAVRIRFTLNWYSERDAMLSYLPKSLRIPLPQHSKPNFETTVMCTDQKAFRNIAITVHGAHFPGRFTFNQMRAALREINFTRKFIFTSLRQSLRDLKQWQNPAMSSFVFLSWMHCIYANSFSLVPAYAVLFFLLFLMRNYAKYCTDAPGQRGFIPPSWEELFMALVRGGDPEFYSIEQLELGVPSRSKSTESCSPTADDFRNSQYKVATHKPRGQKLLQALGFLSDQHRDPNEDHLEFPFADGRDYPKFSVRECLVTHGPGAVAQPITGNLQSDDGMSTLEPGISDGELHQNGVTSRFPLDMDLQRMMRKDSSGTKDFDEEENNFHTTRAVMSQGRKAASKVSKTATALSSKTGLDYVVRPIHSGISSGVGHVSNGVGHMSAVAGNMTSHVMSMPSGMRRRSSMRHTRFEAMDDKLTDSMLGESDFGSVYSNPTQPSSNSILYESGYAGIDNSVNDSVEPINVVQPYVSFPVVAEKIEPSQVYPEQNIDIQGPSNGKKLTDDLAEIKDKMHELTWHLFDDHTYVMKNPNTVFFGEAKGIDKRRKKRDPSKQMNKYLHTAQYSHSNPFVSRVGLYVEPIIGSTYSLLCLFRAGFNVVTWRDPILTFWLSFFCGIIAVVLFVFPWRIFLFVVGFWAVGPQNWAVRVLREQGHIPEVVKEDRKNANEETPRFDIVPVDKPIFTKESRAAGNEPIRAPSLAIDPREIHHVVVPYSPLVYQRCNDWPPEHEYSHVKRDPTYNSSQRNGVTNYNMLRNLSSVSDQPMDSNRLSKLRRRLRRSVASPLEPGTHNKFPERTRVDTA